jgi:hypothetical protein
MNFEFYYDSELAFLEEWLTNPMYHKYETRYVEYVLEEGTKRIKETIKVVQAFATVEEKMEKK